MHSSNYLGMVRFQGVVDVLFGLLEMNMSPIGWSWTSRTTLGEVNIDVENPRGNPGKSSTNVGFSTSLLVYTGLITVAGWCEQLALIICLIILIVF